MNAMRIGLLAIAVATVAVTPAAAQARSPRIFVSVNGGVQAAPEEFTDRLEFEQYLETATVDVSYPSKGTPIFDGSVGIRLWKQLGAGVAFSGGTSDGSAGITGSIPHPFLFNQPREIEGEVSDISRSETAIHGQIFYILPRRGRIQLLLAAGPSRIEVEQDLATAVQFEDEFPFETATFQSATRRSATGSAIGFNAGADVAFMFTRVFGVGGMIRFSRASVDVETPQGRRASVDAGGIQGGGGIRIVF